MNTFRVPRLAVLLGLAALYAAAYLWSGRARQHAAGFDPMAPDVRAVELALRDGRLAAALPLAQSAAAAHPDDPFPMFLLASAHHRLEQWTAAAAAWERYLAQSTSVDAACPDIAIAYDRAGDAERALASYRTCAERDPENPDRVADLAAALSGRGAREEAHRLYERAIALDPGNPLLVAGKTAVE